MEPAGEAGMAAGAGIVEASAGRDTRPGSFSRNRLALSVRRNGLDESYWTGKAAVSPGAVNPGAVMGMAVGSMGCSNPWPSG